MFDQLENERGYYVYVNRFNGSTQQDNPNLTYIVGKITEKFAPFKYSTYRCACKLFALQKALFTCYIPFQTVASILDRHQVKQIDSAPSIKPTQLTAILHDIYFGAEKLGFFSEADPPASPPDRDVLVATLAGLLWAVFDPKRCQPLSAIELKHTLLLLCETAGQEQFIWEHFLLVSDHNLCVSRHRFESMLMNATRLLAFLGESDHLRVGVVQEIVAECFAAYPGLVGPTEYQFSCLWKLSSKFSYYANFLTLVRRLRESEYITHNVACTCCRALIQGLRFKCQKCKSVSLCIDCFCRAYSSKQHNVGHKMYEISRNDVTTSKFSVLLSKLWNLLICASDGDYPTCRVQPSTFENLEAKLIDTNAVELQELSTEPAASSTLVGSCSLYSISTVGGGRRLRKMDVSNCGSDSSKHNGSMFSGGECQLFTSTTQSLMQKLAELVAGFEEQSARYRLELANLKSNNASMVTQEQLEFFDKHAMLLTDQSKGLREVYRRICRNFPLGSSTPNRDRTSTEKDSSSVTNTLDKSLARELNLNEQSLPREEPSIGDVSSWFHLNNASETIIRQIEEDKTITATIKTRSAANGTTDDELTRCIDNLRIDTQMTNFKDLLLKVREIVDDSYSDNVELARTTQQLEKALDRIIEEEERKRIQNLQIGV